MTKIFEKSLAKVFRVGLHIVDVFWGCIGRPQSKSEMIKSGRGDDVAVEKELIPPRYLQLCV